jgi:hypothetical protein
VPTYVNTTTSHGYRQNYTRIPARYGIGRIRLPDDSAEAEAMVKRLIGDAEQNAIETYVTYLMTGSRARAKEKKVPHNLRRLGVLEMLVMQQYKCASVASRSQWRLG